MNWNWFSYAFQSLRRQKVKSIFAIGGVTITLILLSLVGVLSDTLNYSYLNQTTAQVGSADIIFSKILEFDINFDPYFDQSIIESNLRPQIPEIDFYFTRILMLAQISRTNPISGLTLEKQIIFYGINTTLEESSGKMGTLWILTASTYERTTQKYQGPIPAGHCLVTRNFARLFNVSVGQSINTTYTSNQAELIIDAIVEPEFRFSLTESNLVITELTFSQQFFKVPGKVNYVLATLKNPEYIYNTRDVIGTTRKLRTIGEKIQNIVGFDFDISLPKLENLEGGDMMNQAMQMLFYFMTFFAMMITGILLNSILTTNVEERIREFGILQVVGAHKNFTFNTVLVSGFLIAIIGSVLGVTIGSFIGPPILSYFFNTITIGALVIPLKFIILPQTIFTTILLGIGSITGISIFPAVRAGRGAIIKAVEPTRASGQEEYKIRKEGSPNAKLMLFGFGIASLGLIIFLLLPRIIVLSNQIYVLALLISMLLAILLGLVFASVGIIPLLEKLVSFIIKPFIKKYFPIYQISLTRYRRRNIGNMVMFSLSFAFIFFMSTFLSMRTINSDTYLRFQYGSDLILSNDGTLETNNSVTFELLQEIDELPRIRATAPILQNGFDFAKLFSALTRIQTEGIDQATFEGIFGTIPKFDVIASDMGKFRSYYTSICGVDETYAELVNHDLFIWDDVTGSSDACLETLVATPNSCIIAKSLADAFGITKLGQKINLLFYETGEYQHGNVSIFTVVGVSGGMPGFWNFQSSSTSVELAPGIMLNLADYCHYMEWGNPYDPETIVDKIMINLVDNELTNLKDMQSFIKDQFGTQYKFVLDEVGTQIALMRQNNQSINDTLNVVLSVAIIISLFGLISSQYSILIERMYEIGILRAMGLRQSEVRGMLIAESLTIMIAAGSMGMVIGTIIAYILQQNISVLTQLPPILVIDWVTLIRTYLISITIGVLGIWAITWRTRKWRVIDTLRFSW